MSEIRRNKKESASKKRPYEEIKTHNSSTSKNKRRNNPENVPDAMNPKIDIQIEKLKQTRDDKLAKRSSEPSLFKNLLDKIEDKKLDISSTKTEEGDDYLALFSPLPLSSEDEDDSLLSFSDLEAICDDKLFFPSIVNGKGSKIIKKGDSFDDYSIYEGEFKDGLFHGVGVITDSHGKLEYSGNFKDGKYDGNGTLKLPDAQVYEGEFKDGLAHGIGEIKDSTENLKYKGHFQEGKFHGTGFFKNKIGDIYKGEFKLGLMNGKGVFFVNGFNDDIPPFKIHGVFVNNTPTFDVTIEFKNGYQIFFPDWINEPNLSTNQKKKRIELQKKIIRRIRKFIQDS